MYRLKSQSGQALVEFALILAPLLVVIIGVFDFGAAYNQKNDLNFLANSAARYAEVNKCAPCTAPGPNAIRDYVKSTADTDHLKTSVSITFCLPSPLPDGSTNDGGVGKPLRVTASAPYSWLSGTHLRWGNGQPLPLGTITIKSVVTTRILQGPSDGTVYPQPGTGGLPTCAP